MRLGNGVVAIPSLLKHGSDSLVIRGSDFQIAELYNPDSVSTLPDFFNAQPCPSLYPQRIFVVTQIFPV
ncbi:hypothetical protein CCP3SC1AL1_760014 [Gammaproteobacteria bacterium]